MIEEKTISNISCKYTLYHEIGIYYKSFLISTINPEVEYLPIVKIFDFRYWRLNDEDKKNFDEIIKYIEKHYK